MKKSDVAYAPIPLYASSLLVIFKMAILIGLWLTGKSDLCTSKANYRQILQFTPKFVGLTPGPYGGSLL
jgi:hypothetical protein